MVKLVRKEWHQVSKEFEFELTLDMVKEIYPDENDPESMLHSIKEGFISIEDLVEDARQVNVDIDWEWVYDDWWTDRKGGYDVTYEVANEIE